MPKRPSAIIDRFMADLRSPAAKNTRTENEKRIDEHLIAIRAICEKNPKMAQYLKDSFYALLSVIELQEENTKELEETVYKNEIECKLQVTALARKVERMEEENSKFKEKICEFTHRLNNLEEHREKETESIFEEGYRDRSLVFKNLDIPLKQNFSNSQEWIQALKNEVREVLGFLRIEYIPVDVFCMGPYLTKVRMGSRKACEAILAAARRLKGSIRWAKVYIRPSLSEAQRCTRDANFSLAVEERKRRENLGQKVYIRTLSNFTEFEVMLSTPHSYPTRPGNTTTSRRQN